MSGELGDGDRRQLADHGLDEREVRRQLELFRGKPRFARLVRPCTVGDGIEALSAGRIAELTERHASAATAGRFTKFVPASGAASRMFQSLERFRAAAAETDEQRASDEADVRRLLDRIDDFAFKDDLAEALARSGHELKALAADGKPEPILAALLDPDGLGYAQLPKALLKFHASPDGPRTPLEEHLIEAAHYARDADGRCRLHFTVSPEHREGFDALLAAAAPRIGRRHDARFEVTYSVQKASTDTLAVDLENRPLRDAEGRLVLRPGGHGALIENLNDLAADLVFVKNIDNVQPERLRAETLRWKPALAGLAIELQQQVHGALERLETRLERPEALQETLASLARQVHVELNGGRPRQTDDERRATLLERLNRPLRVCGVVPNTGEPGGGPFWVRGADGSVTLQIVEKAEIDLNDPEQRRIFESSTHFNPVDLVCAVRDRMGRPYDLRRFVDPAAVMISTKSSQGVDLKALERPGLWNGAMADWNTVFVEVPLATFSPCKTIFDLLRDEHQG